MKIAFIGKFQKLHDEEYIARSFEMLGHEVLRLSESFNLEHITEQIINYRPKFVLYTKLNNGGNIKQFMEKMRAYNIKTVCWVFDLYWGYPREFRLKSPQFKADYMFSTDGGNQEKFESIGINHFCVRQGIYKDECFISEGEPTIDVAFVGSENPLYEERTKKVQEVFSWFPNAKWFGRRNTDEVRGTKLNDLYATVKIVIGDSVYSPNYWSNRVVETLGRGGFLIHQEVPGLKEEYPYLVTYKKGDTEDLRKKIEFYLKNNKKREELRKKNFEWVRDNYTMDKKCAELLKLMNLHD